MLDTVGSTNPEDSHMDIGLFYGRRKTFGRFQMTGSGGLGTARIVRDRFQSDTNQWSNETRWNLGFLFGVDFLYMTSFGGYELRLYGDANSDRAFWGATLGVAIGTLGISKATKLAN